MRKRNTINGYKIINKGIDAREQIYWLVYDPATGGCKYLWGEKGDEDCWGRFDNSSLGEKGGDK